MPAFLQVVRSQINRLSSEHYRRHVIAGFGVAIAALVVCFTWKSNNSNTSVDDLLNGVPVHPDTLQHSLEFDTPTVYKVTEGVYVAVGFALANSIMIDAPEGLIIVDTTESQQAARNIYREFRKVAPLKPVRAVILTHSHTDHCVGTHVFVENATSPIDVWGHVTFKEVYTGQMLVGPRLSWGSKHQFGTMLGRHLINAGIGPRIAFTAQDTLLPIFPNRFVTTDRQQETIAGMNIEFLLIPGETVDQIGVWIPEKRVVLPADDIYTTFPNLYAIRGVMSRDTVAWYHSLNQMKSLRPSHLVPSHTRPVSGDDVIAELLAVYSAAIEYVHDQTVRLINRNRTPDEISKAVHLPPELKSHLYLQEFYGSVEWSARAVYDRYFGWFSGDPVDLRPLDGVKRAENYIDLVGGWKKAQDAAKTAIDRGEFQWGLELASHLYRAAKDPKSEHGTAWKFEAAKQLRSDALKGLGGLERNPTARNYYLTSAVSDFVDAKVPTSDKRRAIEESSAHALFNFMKVRLMAEKVHGVNWTIVFKFTDTRELFQLTVRYSVLHVSLLEGTDYEGSYDAQVTTTLRTCKELMLRNRSPLLAYMSGDLQIAGSLITLGRFVSSFEQSNLHL